MIACILSSIPRTCRVTLVVLSVLLTIYLSPVYPQMFPGGFLEPASSTDVRPKLTQSQIHALLPTRGKFTFPTPYNTEAVRLTNASDCDGQDCVEYIGYAYWRNMNNHVGSDTMLIFLGLSKERGGTGPTLFSYNKVTDELNNNGPLFPDNSFFSYDNGEGWYFSATKFSILYINDGPKLLRYDTFSKTFEIVFDATTHFGSNKIIWQIHSSNDDNVHSATLKKDKTYEDLGCIVYKEDTKQFFYYPQKGLDYDECQIDKSGRWLLIKEKVSEDPDTGEDNRVIDLQTGIEKVILDQMGAGGHSDNGYGVMVAADNWHTIPGVFRLWNFDQNSLPGSIVYYGNTWGSGPNHVSYANAQPQIPLEQQHVCGSGANRINLTRANEIICFRLDGSQRVLVVAPVMTDLDATGGGSLDYVKMPKGNLDVTGKYFIWTSNMGGERLDAFLVKIPSHLLVP